MPTNAPKGIRMNTAVTYLAMARDRPNLTIRADTLVRRVLFEGTTAIGVEVEQDGQRVELRSDEVVLCASGIKSPHLLLLSGVGPADELRKHGIDVVHDSPGVGRGVKDHPSVFVNFSVKEDAAPPLPDELARLMQTCLNYSAPGSDVDAGELQIGCSATTFAESMKSVGRRGGGQGRLPSYVKRPGRRSRRCVTCRSASCSPRGGCRTTSSSSAAWMPRRAPARSPWRRPTRASSRSSISITCRTPTTCRAWRPTCARRSGCSSRRSSSASGRR